MPDSAPKPTKKESIKSMQKNTKVMLRLADILCQEHLLTPDEKCRFQELLRKDKIS